MPYFNPLTPKIWLSILPCSCYTFPCKLLGVEGLIMFLRSTFRRFSPSGRMIKSLLLSLISVEKDHTNVTQAFKSHASKDWVKPNKYQHLSFEFLSWKSFTFNFLVKKGCKCDWIFGSLDYRAQLMNIALNNWNCESKYKHYQKVAFITWVYL